MGGAGRAYFLTSSPPLCRRCTYPQQLVLTFPAPVRLHALQLLAHEYKIAAAVDLAIAAPDGLGAALARTPAAAAALGSPLVWRPLGRLAFDPNVRSGHAARELKSVALDGVPAVALRITLHAPHANALNCGGQVGLVALNAVGEAFPGAPVPAAPADTGHLTAAVQQQATPVAGLATPAVPVSLSAPLSPPSHPHHPTNLTTALARLEVAKAAAADAEDYDAAAALKAAAAALRGVCARLDAVLARQTDAAGVEDYGAAKVAKGEADGARSEGAALVAGVEAGQWGEAAAAALASVAEAEAEEEAAEAGPGAGAAPHRSTGGVAPPHDDAWSLPPPRLTMAAAAPAANSTPAPARPLTQLALDDRPLPARASTASFDGGHQPFFLAAAGGGTPSAAASPLPPPPASSTPPLPGGPAATPILPPPATAASSDALAGLADLVAACPPPPGWPADLPPPDPPKDEAAAKEAAPLAAAHGWFTAAGLSSRAWAVREAAWGVVGTALGAGGGGGAAVVPEGDRREYGRALARAAAAAAARDRVPAVVAAALEAAVAAVAAAAPSHRDAAALTTDILPAAVDRLADTNARAGTAAAGALRRLAECSPRGVGGVLAALMRVNGPVPATAPRTLAARLGVLTDLVPLAAAAASGVWGAPSTSSPGAPPPPPHASPDLEAVARFAIAAASSAAAPVRVAALDLARACGRVLGPGVGAGLAPAAVGVNAKLRKALVAALAPPPTVAAVGAKADQLVAGATADFSLTADAAGGGGAGAPPPAMAADPLAAQDPALLEAEVARREAAHGPTHPRVADALAGLAVVLAARGDRSPALALLERAVGVYEQACGPDSPDTAAALTDLAVLHLEGGDEGRGRPLLVRALAIQSAALGAGHPDVMAIRDVLEAAG